MSDLKVKEGLMWNSLNNIFTIILTFVINILIARYLGVEKLGVFSTIIIYITFMNIYNDFGISRAIVAKKNISDRELSSIFYVNMVIGIMTFLIAIIIIPFYCKVYKIDVEIEMVIISFSFIISSFGMVHKNLLLKKFKYYLLFISSFISNLFYLVYVVSVLQYKKDIIVVVIGYVGKIIIENVIYLILERWIPKLYFNFDEIKGIMKFGAFVLGEQSLNFLKRNMDYLMIGKVLGMEALGIYTVAYNLMIFPIMKLSPIISNTFFPIFSNNKNINYIREMYFKIINKSSYLMFPVLFGIAVVSQEIVLIFYGQEYILASSVMRILIFVAIMQSISTFSGTIFHSLERADISFKFNLYTTVVVAIAFRIGALYGIVSVAIAYFVYSVIANPVLWYIVVKQLKGEMICYITNIYKPLILSTLMSISIITISKLADFSSVMNNLFLKITIGVVSYSIMVVILNPDEILEFLKIKRIGE